MEILISLIVGFGGPVIITS